MEKMLKKPSLNLGVLLLVLIFLDIATTFYGIHYLGSYEANFLISWLPLELVSIFKILVGIYLIELIQRGRRYFGKKIELILLPPIIVYSIVVSNNIVQILERIR